MHSSAEVSDVLALRERGLGARRIARRLGLPLSTVKDWLAGKLPAHSRPAGSSTSPEPRRPACGHLEHEFRALADDYVYLLGLYLGDGCISEQHRGVHRLRIALDTRYPGVLQSAACAIAAVNGGKSHVQACVGNWVEVSGYWRCWPCLFPQRGPGPKHARPIVLTNWQVELVDRWPEQLLRGLIQSDGCRFQNTCRGGWVCPRYAFSQASKDIQHIFRCACDRLGVHWTKSGERTIYGSRKADVARLDEFIGAKC